MFQAETFVSALTLKWRGELTNGGGPQNKQYSHMHAACGKELASSKYLQTCLNKCFCPYEWDPILQLSDSMDWEIKNWMQNIPISSPILSGAPSFSPPSHASTSPSPGNVTSPYYVGSQATQFYEVVCLFIDQLQVI